MYVDFHLCCVYQLVTWNARPWVRPIADLNDFEEMMLSLVHPFVQVYTIPTTGELAFAGHVCNFRQRVHEWVKELPVRPKNMPYVLVKPRPNQTDPDQRPRLPFAVDVQKVKRAYEWLRQYNHHYKDVPWSDANADAWTNETEQVPTREEDITQHLSQCSTTLVKRRMSGLEQGEAGGQEQTASWKCRTAFGMDSDVDESWQNVTHYMGGHYRVARSLTSRELYRAIVAKTLYPVGRDQGEALEELRERGEWEDGWEREDTRKAMPKLDAPRVDEKDPIREDEKDYIAKAFVGIFPFGAGCYYTAKNGLEAAPSFADWATHVLGRVSWRESVETSESRCLSGNSVMRLMRKQ